MISAPASHQGKAFPIEDAKLANYHLNKEQSTLFLSKLILIGHLN